MIEEKGKWKEEGISTRKHACFSIKMFEKVLTIVDMSMYKCVHDKMRKYQRL